MTFLQTLTDLRTERDALIRDLLSHTLSQIQDDRGGWASDRLAAISAVDCDLMELDDDHRSFSYPRYLSRLIRSGRPLTYRPLDPFRGR